jgi:hypothetical protein
MLAIWKCRKTLKRIATCKRALPRIIPPRAQVHKVVVVQLTGEAERLRCCTALRQAEGAEAQAGGGEGRAGGVEGLAHGAEGVV